jgi:hypothetical protein
MSHQGQVPVRTRLSVVPAAAAFATGLAAAMARA